MRNPFELKPHLFPRGAAGLACDVEGVALGPVILVEKSNAIPGNNYRLCPPEVFAKAFITAYGKPPLDMLMYLWEGIGRVTKSLEEGDVTLAMMKAIHLKFPEIESDNMAKLAAVELAKAGYNPDEPRDDWGRWTSDGAAEVTIVDSRELTGRQYAQADTGIMSDTSPDISDNNKHNNNSSVIIGPVSSDGTVASVKLKGFGDTYLEPDFAARVKEFDKLAREEGVEIHYTSAYRTPEKQEDMWLNHIGTTPAKNSLHSAGLAIDVVYDSLSSQEQRIIRDAGAKAGLKWGGDFRSPNQDYRHFYYDPGGDRKELIRNFNDSVSRLRQKNEKN